MTERLSYIAFRKGEFPPARRSSGRRGPQRRTVAETTIVYDILRLLQVHPKVAWAVRMNTGAVKIQGSRNERRVRFGFVGCSDIIGMLVDGRFLALEVKTETGRVTLPQQHFIDRVNKHHGVGAVVRSLAGVDRILKATSIVRGT